MPPKRNRGGRGGSRGGGRGGSRGGRGRGGSGSLAPLKLSKSLKRRSRKRGSSEILHDGDMPELMDLGQDIYTGDIRTEKPLMKSLSKRPNKFMMNEARYTDMHMEKTMMLKLRNRPVEFVKAELKYDPSKDLIDELRKNSTKPALNDSKPENDSDMIIDTIEAELSLPDGLLESALMSSSTTTSVQSQPVEISSQDSDTMEGIPEESLDELQKLIMGNNNDDIPQHTDDASQLSQTDSSSNQLLEEAQADKKATLIVQEVDVPVEQVDVPVEEVDVPIKEVNEIPNESDSEINMSELEDSEEEDSGFEYSIDQIGDDNTLLKFEVSKPSTSSLLWAGHNNRKLKHEQDSFTEIESKKPGVSIEPYLTVGKVILKTSFDEDGVPSVSLPSYKTNRKANSGFVLLDQRENDKRDHFQTGKKNLEPVESRDSDLDAAFEDYMSQLMAANEEDSDFDSDSSIDQEKPIYDSDGNESDYGVHDNDDEEIYDQLREEEKLAFNQVDPSDESSIDFDRYMDELGFDQLDDSDTAPNSEEEGLEDILAFARQQRRLADLELGTNVAPKKVGKGSKQRLELGSELELELRESLMEQFHYQKQSKRLKKLRKKEKKLLDALNNLTLMDKYEYSLHIKEIKQEFETFLHDANRETLSFPPLDGHGNKTLSKLANNYNMKCIKAGGNGTALYMKIAKTRKTFRYVPDYQLIGYIMKQRPVFRRADVKPRTKDEIIETDDDKMRRGPKSNAYVREGDVVGGLAPEISQNNIGRKMLEMLGWLRGEGLGALGNKGISTPVLATVKKSKAGLK